MVNEDGTTTAGSPGDTTMPENTRRMPAAALKTEADRHTTESTESAAERNEHKRRSTSRHGHHSPPASLVNRRPTERTA
jgi:hypothetical protein